MLHSELTTNGNMTESKSAGRVPSDLTSTHAEIVGWGKCLPPATLTNADLSTFLDTSDEWIFKRTGIKSRPISHVPVSQLAHVAALRALASAGLDPASVDLVILGSCTADEQMPNTSSRVQRSIGAIRAAAIDVNTACTSFMYALSYASALIRVGSIQNAVVIGSDTLSSFMDWDDRRPSVVFGDGAGAVVLHATDERRGIIGEKLGCIYEKRDVLRIKGIGAAYANEDLTYGTTEWDFDGREVFRLAVNSMTGSSKMLLNQIGFANADVDLVIPHQANLRIVEAVARRLNMPMGKIFVNLERCGNLSSASIPVAIVDALEEGKILPNSTVLVPAFGGGMTWSAHLIRWGSRVTSCGTSVVRLSETSQSGLDLVRALRDRKGNAPSGHLPASKYEEPAQSSRIGTHHGLDTPSNTW
jgi:3-oxoacyl-[acyl-carrier-protein] synthase III